MKKRIIILLLVLMSMTLTACNGNNSNYVTRTKSKEVEITIDNWQDYFVEKDLIKGYYNDFDELEDVVIHQALVLKDDINIDPFQSNVVVEYKGKAETYYVNVNTDTWKYNFEEKMNNASRDVSKIEEFGLKSYRQGNDEKEYYALEFCGVVDHWVWTDSESGRQYIEKYTIDEIVRIKGTLIINE